MCLRVLQSFQSGGIGLVDAVAASEVPNCCPGEEFWSGVFQSPVQILTHGHRESAVPPNTVQIWNRSQTACCHGGSFRRRAVNRGEALWRSGTGMRLTCDAGRRATCSSSIRQKAFFEGGEVGRQQIVVCESGLLGMDGLCVVAESPPLATRSINRCPPPTRLLSSPLSAKSSDHLAHRFAPAKSSFHRRRCLPFTRMYSWSSGL